MLVTPSNAAPYTFDDPTPTEWGEFGNAVSLDGNHVLIGARNANEYVGEAHLFDAATGNLLHTFNGPSPTTSDCFGDSVALDGNNVLIGASGANEAHLFDALTGNLLQTFNDPTPTKDYFGRRVSLDGNNILIGASGDDTNGPDVGQAHLFTIPDGGYDLPGDFDLNSVVDGIDFLKWQRGESPNPLSVIDFTDWEENFGAVLPAVAAAVSTPEPSSLLLASLAGLLFCIRKRRV